MATMNTDQAWGWLIVGSLNDHYPHPDDLAEATQDPMGSGGCIINCGPCGALYCLAQTAADREHLERLIRLTGFQKGGWCYWDDDSDSLRWDWFQSYWNAHKACAISDGVLQGCTFDGEED